MFQLPIKCKVVLFGPQQRILALRVQLILARLLDDTLCLTLGQVKHDLLEFCIEVVSQVAVDLGLDTKPRPVTEEELLVKQSDLVINFCNVFKLICVDTISSG